MANSDYAAWFRGSTPYISAHRDKTFVVLLPGEAIAHANLTNIVHDLALLHVLGVRLVLVHGARPQIAAALPDSTFHGHRRITANDDMQAISGIHGQVRTTLEALFSTGLPNSPLHNVEVPVISGNFIVAQPIGILDGTDHLCTGSVRRVEVTRIRTTLKHGGVVLQSPIGYSPSGQAFNLAAEELATDVAIALDADKLIVFDELTYLADDNNQRISTLTPTSLQQHIDNLENPAQANRLACLARAVHGGVSKAQLVSYAEDGALLAELFTADGHGTQILEQPRQSIRPAQPADITDIVEIIRPLEEQGILVRRERERLEQEVRQFLVAEVDGIVAGCCALYPYGDTAELACVAVHQNFRRSHNNRMGQHLLQAAEAHASSLGISKLFVLTTQTSDWFREHGFADASPEDLPTTKSELYNWQRNAQVMCKTLKET